MLITALNHCLCMKSWTQSADCAERLQHFFAFYRSHFCCSFLPPLPSAKNMNRRRVKLGKDKHGEHSLLLQSKAGWLLPYLLPQALACCIQAGTKTKRNFNVKQNWRQPKQYTLRLFLALSRWAGVSVALWITAGFAAEEKEKHKCAHATSIGYITYWEVGQAQGGSLLLRLFSEQHPSAI